VFSLRAEAITRRTPQQDARDIPE